MNKSSKTYPDLRPGKRARGLTAIRAVVAMLCGLGGVALAQSETDATMENLAKILPPQLEVKSVQQTPMDGVYLVNASGRNLYVYSKDEFVMIGEVFDTERRVSLAQEHSAKERAVALKELDAMPESNMVVMGDTDADRYVTVFTDTDCGWCQKFHQDVPELAAGGLKIHYLMWPRAGLDSDSYREAVSVWCAEDQGKAMTAAKSGQEIPQKTCDNPVKEHYELGFRLGVQGTPYVMLDNGKVLGGYVPPETLLSEAGLK